MLKLLKLNQNQLESTPVLFDPYADAVHHVEQMLSGWDDQTGCKIEQWEVLRDALLSLPPDASDDCYYANRLKSSFQLQLRGEIKVARYQLREIFLKLCKCQAAW